MVKTRQVALFTANRAERGLLEPVKLALEAEGVKPVWVNITPSGHHPIMWGLDQTQREYRYAYEQNRTWDLALVPCDRIEMVGVALWLFTKNIPFAQLHAGDTGSGVHDEVFRWIISRCASLLFCNSPESAQALLKSGEEPWRVHLVGSTAFDNIELDESGLPCEPYDLLLVHPDTFSEDNTRADIKAALSETRVDRLTVAIGPNHDKYWEIIDTELSDWAKTHYVLSPTPGHPMDLGPYGLGYPKKFSYTVGVPRPHFLALMKHCHRFITNSSSALYELPAFDIQKWVPIGKRNANRKPLDKIETGASKRIAQVLAAIPLERLLRKKFS